LGGRFFQKEFSVTKIGMGNHNWYHIYSNDFSTQRHILFSKATIKNII